MKKAALFTIVVLASALSLRQCASAPEGKYEEKRLKVSDDLALYYETTGKGARQNW